MTRRKQFLCLALAVLMCISLFPVSTFAEAEEDLVFEEADLLLEESSDFEAIPAEVDAAAVPAEQTAGEELIPEDPTEEHAGEVLIPEDPAEEPAAEECDSQEALVAEAEEEETSHEASAEAEEELELAPDEIIGSGYCGDNLQWTLDNKGTLIVRGTGPMYDYQWDNEPPWTILYVDKIQEVIVESGVTSIGTLAFSDIHGLKSATIAETVTRIGERAFHFSYVLEKVNIPKGVTCIEDGTFEWCAFRSIDIPDTVTSIGKNAFYKCSLSSITIPDSVGSIGDYAFYGCGGLTSVALPAFVDLGYEAFYGCDNVTDVYYGGNQALKNLNYPSILYQAEWHYREVDGWGYCGDNVFWQYDDTSRTLRIKGEGAMWDCESKYDYHQQTPWEEMDEEIVKVELGSGITRIGKYAFQNITNITELPIPDTVTEIGEGAFCFCSALQRVSIPDGVTAIESMTFSVCSALTSITIPEKVTGIGTFAFEECTALTEIFFLGSAPSFGEFVFRNVTATAYYPVDKSWPDEVKLDYDGHLTWESYQPKPPIALDQTVLELHVGQTETLHAVNAAQGASLVWSSSNDKVASADQSGTVTGMGVGKAMITVTDAASGANAECTVTVLFDDVADSTAYFYSPVYWAVDNGVTAGTSPTTFSPGNSCTRGQIVTFLWKAMGSPEPGSLNNPFTDVKERDYFYKPVLWARERGITSGKTATTFAPTAPCTRGQIVTFLWIAKGRPTPTDMSNPFTDVSASDYFYRPVLWARENGITSGTGAVTFSPGKTCTRAQAMTFLHKACSLPDSGGGDAGFAPTGPVTMIVAYCAGSGTDTTTRILASYAEKYVGQSISIKNVAGGSGSIAWSELAAANPDGMTIGVINLPNFCSSIVNGLGSYTLQSFAPICNHITETSVVIVRADDDRFPDLNALITYGRKYQGSRNELIASTNGPQASNHIGAQAFANSAGFMYTDIPMENTADQLMSLFAGEADFSVVKLADLAGVEADCSILGVFAEKRLPELPDVPTLGEMGCFQGWLGASRCIVAPAGVRENVIRFYEEAFRQAMHDPDYLSAAEQAGMTTDYLDAVTTGKRMEQQQAFAESLTDGFWYEY